MAKLLLINRKSPESFWRPKWAVDNMLPDTVAAGETECIYRESGSVRLEDSPTPRFDLLNLPLYRTATRQF